MLSALLAAAALSTEPGAISGRVLDGAGDTVAGAAIIVTDAATGAVRPARADELDHQR